ncbi:UNVERIFIED_CONTAM: hypothetical protein Scaly_2748700 [Sesamum calycinum]|uniref:Reverse transcriptase zinc-binding domain-containing protein n=1 Tax=Sesamum calycinum TaxID=2727403 RepID=A0AAW2J134_9LAMI
MTVNFFWQQDSERKIHWVAWRTLCKRKEKGRLGFRSLKELNMAILCKQAWQLETDLDSLLHHMLSCCGGFRWRIREGSRVRIVHDTWISIPIWFNPIFSATAGVFGKGM